MARCYNFIYSKLVNGEDDIVGHIAYALYKADKIHFIEKFKEDNAGKEPEEDDLKPFHTTSSITASVDRYRNTAIAILQTFTSQTLSEIAYEIEQDVIQKTKSELANIIEPLKPASIKKRYFHGVAQSVIGTFVFMIIALALLFVISLSTKQYTFTIGADGNAKIEQHTPARTN